MMEMWFSPFPLMWSDNQNVDQDVRMRIKMLKCAHYLCSSHFILPFFKLRSSSWSLSTLGVSFLTVKCELNRWNAYLNMKEPKLSKHKLKCHISNLICRKLAWKRCDYTYLNLKATPFFSLTHLMVNLKFNNCLSFQYVSDSISTQQYYYKYSLSSLGLGGSILLR